MSDKEAHTLWLNLKNQTNKQASTQVDTTVAECTFYTRIFGHNILGHESWPVVVKRATFNVRFFRATIKSMGFTWHSQQSSAAEDRRSTRVFVQRESLLPSLFLRVC